MFVLGRARIDPVNGDRPKRLVESSGAIGAHRGDPTKKAVGSPCSSTGNSLQNSGLWTREFCDSVAFKGCRLFVPMGRSTPERMEGLSGKIAWELDAIATKTYSQLLHGSCLFLCLFQQ